jgi:predicted dehydrogenase
MLKEMLQNFPSFTAPLVREPEAGLCIAVVGCGYWGAKHVRVLSTLTDVREVIVVEPGMSARKSILQSFPNIDVVSSLQSVLHRVQGVVIATPPRNHAEVALQALRAGKHVLIEKPVTTSLQQARKLIQEAALCDSVLMVGHTFEFNPAVQELRRRMDAGELGDIKYIHSARLNLGLYRSDVNVIWDLAPHDISIMNYLLRSTPTVAKAWGSSHIAANIIDLAHFQLDYGERGIIGHGHVSWLDPRKVRQVTVVGTRKMAVYDDVAEEKLRIYDRGVICPDEGFANGSKLHEIPASYRQGDIVSPQIQSHEPLRLEDQHFVDCIRQRTNLLSDGTSGAAVVAALEAIDQAVKSGQSVMIEPHMETSEILPRLLTN